MPSAGPARPRCPHGDGVGLQGHGGRRPADPPTANRASTDQRTVAALQQPAENRHRPQGDEGITDVPVDEGGRDEPPPVRSRRAEIPTWSRLVKAVRQIRHPPRPSRMSAPVAYGARIGPDPGISPGRRRGKAGVGGRRRRRFSATRPSRSILGARLRSLLPQYGHSVMYGLTSAPQLLQTTKRSGFPVLISSADCSPAPQPPDRRWSPRWSAPPARDWRTHYTAEAATISAITSCRS